MARKPLSTDRQPPWEWQKGGGAGKHERVMIRAGNTWDGGAWVWLQAPWFL